MQVYFLEQKYQCCMKAQTLSQCLQYGWKVRKRVMYKEPPGSHHAFTPFYHCAFTLTHTCIICTHIKARISTDENTHMPQDIASWPSQRLQMLFLDAENKQRDKKITLSTRAALVNMGLLMGAVTGVCGLSSCGAPCTPKIWQWLHHKNMLA